MKKILYTILGILLLPVLAFAINITVPSCPTGSGCGLVSTSTGAYVATTTYWLSSASGTALYVSYNNANANVNLNNFGITSAYFQSASTTALNYILNSLGIGTTSPQGMLDVSGSNSGTDSTVFVGARAISLINTNTTNNNMSGLDFRTNDANGLLTTGSKIMGVYTSHAANAVSGDISFLTRNAGTISEKMRILGSGNVGIGTSSPSQTLDIWGNLNVATGTQPTLLVNSSAGLGNGMIVIGGSPLAAPISIQTNNSGATMAMQNSSTAGVTGFNLNTSSGVLATSIVHANSSASANPNSTYIGTRNAESLHFVTNGTTPRMSITSAGNVGIGNTVPAGLLDVGSTKSATPSLSTGAYFAQSAYTFTDNNTASGTTATGMTWNSYAQQTLAATNASTTYTNLFGTYIAGAPTISGNIKSVGSSTALYIDSKSVTASTTNSYGLYVNAQTLATNNYAASFIGGNVGVGTTSPAGVFSVKGSSNNDLIVVASSTGTTYYKLDKKGHETTASSTEITPTLSSCGTSPVAAAGSNDRWGEITAGATANGCTITFKQPYTNAPSCIVTDETQSLVNALSYTESNTALTVTQTGIGGGIFDYRCGGLNE